MKYATVLLSGAGQLGSRHLQGLAACALPLDIHVHDNNPESLKMSEARWGDVVSDNKAQHRVRFHTSFHEVPRQIDVALVATPAHVRPQVVAAIAHGREVNYWILEKVLARSVEALDQIRATVGNLHKAWVNTPRRSLPWHREIKKALRQSAGQSVGGAFDGAGPMNLRVEGGDWGLACNSIHFLDMFAWWTDETLVEVNTDRLNTNWIAAKRAGNLEVMGTLEARFSGGSRAQLMTQTGEVFWRLEFTDGDYLWKMDEMTGTAVRSDGLSIPGRVPYQSEMTGAVVQTLLETGTCGLPGLEVSCDMHAVYLRSLLTHWQRHGDANAREILIT